MRFRAVAVILLLALVRSSSSTSAVDVAKNLKILDLIPNTLTGVGLGLMAKEGDEVNPAFVSALNTGIQCENTDKVKDALYAIYGKFEASDIEAYRKAEDPPFECSSTNELHKCVCAATGKETPSSCLVKSMAKIYNQAPQGSHVCLQEALEQLRTKLPKLAAAYDFSEFNKTQVSYANSFDKTIKNKDVNAIDALIKKAGDDLHQFYCEFLDPKADELISNVVSSNGAYMVLDNLVYSALFESVHWEFAGHSLGKCVCDFKKGMIFCLYKLFAEFFKQEGFLTCDAANSKFDLSKKPTTLPQMPPKPTKGQIEEARKKKNAAPSLSLAPLAALSGLFLLLQHLQH